MTFILALLTGLGVGSGGLYILYLTLVRGLAQAEAQGMNLAFFITAMSAAAAVNIFKKRISGISVLLVLPLGALGAAVGSRLASEVGSRLLTVIFGIFLITVGTVGLVKMMLTNKRR